MKTVRAIAMGAGLAVIATGTVVSANSRFQVPRIDTAQKLDGLSLSELRMLRNTVFAIHGYEFKSVELQRAFWNLPWYQKIRRDMERAGKRFLHASLSAAERRFVERIKAREKALKVEVRHKKRPDQLYNYQLLANANQFPGFHDKAKRMIEDNGFVVLPAKHEQFFFVYEDNDYRMIPSFITSDSVLQLYHVFFDFSLRDVEQNKLLPAARSLSAQLLAHARVTVTRNQDITIKRAAELLSVYFAVAQALFSGKKPRLAGGLKKTLDAELALIRQHSGRMMSPLLGHKMDYSQFIPRGHYTRSKALKRFFLGMMWFGQVVFQSKSDDQLRAMLLLSYYLNFYKTHDHKFATGPLRVLWETIYEPTAFYVGRADDLSPIHVRQVTEAVYGSGALKVHAFVDVEKLKQVRLQLAKRDPQRIKTTFEKMPNCGVRFMGQRYIPDSEILQKLIHYIKRPFPKGLDLFAVFGDADAQRLLDKHYNEPQRWEGYLPTRNKLEKQFRNLPKKEWSQNLYWSWLDSLRVLTRERDAKAPPFAQTRAWRLKQLHTALASWAELRHDTILYAKPFGAECGGGDEPPKTRGYVEPVPRFYARLRALLTQTREGLAKRKLLTTRFREVGKNLDDLLSFLERVARKQLAGTAVTAGEYEQIRLYGTELQALTTQMLTDFSAYTWGEVHGPDRNVAVVADIGTTANTALEEAVGPVGEIFVVVEIDGAPTLMRGAVFSYYEFTWPVSDRLTDEKWQKLLKTNKSPPQPDWVQQFMFPQTCPKMPNVLFYSSGC